MKKTFLGLVALAILMIGCASAPNTADYAAFGAPLVVEKPVALADAIAMVDESGPQDLLVDAEIAEVCASMGCWMILKDGEQTARVRFTASDMCSTGYLVPRNAAGHRTFVRGTLEATEIPEDWARHYAKDGGASAQEIAKIIGPQKEYVLIAEGVMISDGATLDPTADQMEE
ncbi:DUF4920 domain-containing protein [bacterium]|nr:DUF4920 domain-containing protein [bacterium]